MSNFKGIVAQLQESVDSDILFDMYEALSDMIVELSSLKRKTETKMDVEEAHSAINAFDLPEEFTVALERYNSLVEVLHGQILGVD